MLSVWVELMQTLDWEIKSLLDQLERLQWSHRPNFDLVARMPIMTRSDLQRLKMQKGVYATHTSGSTGEPVTVEKTFADYVWYIATNIRERIWRKWNFSRNVAVVKAGAKTEDINHWGIPRIVAPSQGMTYRIDLKPVSILQTWLEEKNPHYLHCRPSVISQLDLSRVPNLIDCKGTGEAGGTLYSSEECGSIAIQCPDNKAVYHVMENQLVEVDSDGALIISTLTNPYIRRYKHGDHIELGKCDCGRTLQTITKINGRVRNMFVLPNGDRVWPIFGAPLFYEKFGIKRFKAIQTSVMDFELQIVSPPLMEREAELRELVRTKLGFPVNVHIVHVDGFPINEKYEEFTSRVVG
ncbi:MAG: hypothetical protein EBV06_00640 [Planctomycetia bacterium]|nr:hypothetical protein [Planctomycetia bacterium]